MESPEFYAVEASEYLVQLRVLASHAEPSAIDHFVELSRSLRGSSLMANQQAIGRAAAAAALLSLVQHSHAQAQIVPEDDPRLTISREAPTMLAMSWWVSFCSMMSLSPCSLAMSSRVRATLPRPPVINVPLAAQDGHLFLGPFKIVELPPLLE